MQHGISFDVECYRQIHWNKFLGTSCDLSPDVERSTHLILDALCESGTKATFFIVGNVARRFPNVVRRIQAEGHELGTHGNEHRDVRDLDEPRFRDEVARGRDAIQEVVGEFVVAHRAPMFSIVSRSCFALQTLRDLGFFYDSSIFPFRGTRYGDPSSPPAIHQLANGLWEVPLSVVGLWGRSVPALGGGYVRHAPLSFSRWAMGRREATNQPAVSYFHPWEFSLDPLTPRLTEFLSAPQACLRLMWFNLSRHPGRGPRMLAKLVGLLRAYEFVPLRTLVNAQAEVVARAQKLRSASAGLRGESTARRASLTDAQP